MKSCTFAVGKQKACWRTVMESDEPLSTNIYTQKNVYFHKQTFQEALITNNFTSTNRVTRVGLEPTTLTLKV